MKNIKIFAISVLAFGMFHGAAANSSVIGSLVFIDPTGTVGANESIDVWVRLTLDPSSDSLTYDASASFPSGVNPDDIPTEGFNDFGDLVPFDEYDFVSQYISRSCDDTFTVGCSSPGSQYSYSVPASDGWFAFSGTINPGASMDFILYTLTPVSGTAAPGTYELFTGALGLLVVGTDVDGNSVDADVYRFATDCPDANCTFSRTVVPVPAAVWFLGSALFGLAGLARRK